MNFDLETFHKFDFTGSQITAHNIWQSQGTLYNLNLEGSFEKEQYENCRFWCFWFKHFENQGDANIADLTGNRISFLDICLEGELFLVKMILETNDDTREIVFRCREVRVNYYRYTGMSYRNLYGTEDYQKFIDKQRYVLDKKYFVNQEEIALPDGYSVETALYNDSAKYAFKARLQKCILKKSGKTIYEYLCTYYHGARFKDFILHSNGRRYFPFHVDLYGISYLDIDSLEAYHYVPEGYAHDFNYPFGESFIITNIYYDKNTDLIAYGGCYWAGPSDVMVGDFSEPLNFNPKLFDISKILDPDSEGYEIDFKQWQDDKLVVTVEGEEKKISVEEIIKAIKYA
ncbi:MAG: hypothetical protein J1E83_06355 [Lachnospiraceae bacterium]|nr:hypothetical protein [Lachnospiraceae bacterium]